MDDGIKKCSSWVKAERAQKAAPEMLEALLLFVEYESASESNDDVAMMIAYAEFKRAAHSAIAAATGE